MGQQCSSAAGCTHVESDTVELSRSDSPDPVMYDLMRKSIQATASSSSNYSGSSSSPGVKSSKRRPPGQQHLLYKHSNNRNSSGPSSHQVKSANPPALSPSSPMLRTPDVAPSPFPTRLLIRRRSLRVVEEGEGTHIYAIRYPADDAPSRLVSEQATPSSPTMRQEQCPPKTKKSPLPSLPFDSTNAGAEVFTTAAMGSAPRQSVMDWVTVSEEHNIYIADVGLTSSQCDHVVSTTEQACRGQYAAYTYAKQTLGCREYPILSQTSFFPVHTCVHAIIQKLVKDDRQLQLDDREPHIVKYDVTRKERQKLDMHTDKSEWTFLIALSNGCGVDYEGGGTYFECLDATVHLQRGHALIFPGKLRHCGQKITSGLRFLLVGFLVDKSSASSQPPNMSAALVPGASSSSSSSGVSSSLRS